MQVIVRSEQYPDSRRLEGEVVSVFSFHLTRKLILKLCVDDRAAVGVEVVLYRYHPVHPRTLDDGVVFVGLFMERHF